MPFNVFAGIDDADSAFAEEEAIKWLSDHFERSVSRETGLVSARVTTESSVGSRYLAQALFGKLETLLVQMRSEEARREREFADRQLLDARERLESAERRLTDFAVANRMYAESPALRAQFETIQRDVSFNEQVVRGLLTAREDASLKEARRSSGLSVVERPVIAGRADRRFLLIRGFVGAIVGGAGAAVLLSLLLVAASDHRLHWVELAVAKVLRL